MSPPILSPKSASSLLAAAVVLLLAAAGHAEDVPFAAPPAPGAPPRVSEDLGALLSLIQGRHMKLFWAGTAANWGLVTYQTTKIKDDLDRAATLYVNLPVEAVVSAQAPLADMRAAAAARDVASFNRAYGRLTTACNSCHVAGGLAFIRIQTPTASPFTDETFFRPTGPNN